MVKSYRSVCCWPGEVHAHMLPVMGLGTRLTSDGQPRSPQPTTRERTTRRRAERGKARGVDELPTLTECHATGSSLVCPSDNPRAISRIAPYRWFVRAMVFHFWGDSSLFLG
ncbi:hypothetical protein CDAR_89951 [Caerostris darwini]|uniref:Uncharacterized protein n=1 Tax=Caerostris darwini TaxID=1538125 RepID=A0AAV4RDQ1_9ARAC|nr:hypothetical protein CDAR_89951 [Caerostris darwini]